MNNLEKNLRTTSKFFLWILSWIISKLMDWTSSSGRMGPDTSGAFLDFIFLISEPENSRVTILSSFQTKSNENPRDDVTVRVHLRLVYTWYIFRLLELYLGITNTLFLKIVLILFLKIIFILFLNIIFIWFVKIIFILFWKIIFLKIILSCF